jgi:hypothetical protein
VIYDEDYYNDHADGMATSAAAVVPLICDLILPRSVIDYGCGRGFWLREFQKQPGVEYVCGYDGDWVIDPVAHPTYPLDLTKPFSFGPVDLAVSLEVAEHLPESRATGFVEDICFAAPVVMFSAAIPGQGGIGHVNEQWPAYWHARFRALDFLAFDCIRPQIWDNESVGWWYRQNIFVYAEMKWLRDHSHAMARMSAHRDMPDAVVHPRCLEFALEEKPE